MGRQYCPRAGVGRIEGGGDVDKVVWAGWGVGVEVDVWLYWKVLVWRRMKRVLI